MNINYTNLAENNTHNIGNHELALAVLEGLSGKPKKLNSSFFYDQKGSDLFQQITELDEYYLTGCEFDILTKEKENIAKKLAKDPFNLIELGSGDGRKTFVLLDEFIN